MQLVNLTGCRIIVSDDRGGIVRIIEPRDEHARLEGSAQSTSIDDIPVDYVTPDRITGLPAPQEGVLYIVNPDVARATDRDDVLTPELSRDSEHMVADTYVGVQRLLSVKRKRPETPDSKQ